MNLKHQFPTKMMKILRTAPMVATMETGRTKMKHLKEPLKAESQLTTPEKLCGDVTSVVSIHDCIVKNVIIRSK